MLLKHIGYGLREKKPCSGRLSLERTSTNCTAQMSSLNGEAMDCSGAKQAAALRFEISTNSTAETTACRVLASASFNACPWV